MCDDWTVGELQSLVSSGFPLSTRTPGLRGVLTALRGAPDGAAASSSAASLSVVLSLPFGTAYLRVSDLSPPPRHAPGARVRTPFGRGVVTARRARPGTAAGYDYAVELIDNRLSGWTAAEPRCAAGYLAPRDVVHRPDDERTADECVADADLMRTRGNAAFKVRRERRAPRWSRSALLFAFFSAALYSCAPSPPLPGRGLRVGAGRVRALLRGALELPRRPARRRDPSPLPRVLPQERRQQRADIPQGDAAELRARHLSRRRGHRHRPGGHCAPALQKL